MDINGMDRPAIRKAFCPCVHIPSLSLALGCTKHGLTIKLVRHVELLTVVRALNSLL